jgi:hypothetical protein
MLLQIKAWAGTKMYQRAHNVADLQSFNCATSNAFAAKVHGMAQRKY